MKAQKKVSKQQPTKKPTKTQKKTLIKKKSNPKHEQKKPRIIRKTMLVLFLCILTLAIATLGTFALIYNSQTLSAEKLSNHPRLLQIYADNGDLIEDTGDYRNTDLSTLNEHTKWAFICTEDKHFYRHHGLAPARIAKAMMKNMKTGYAKEGASTISQQLIKNTHLTHEKTMQRKIREAALAHKLERKYTKNEILQMYFNAIYFGNGVYGLESASHYYFGKSASDLSARESAALAGMIRNPARYCPLTNFDNFVLRSDLILKLMHSQKKLTDQELQTAMTQTPTITTEKRTRTHSTGYKAAAAAEAARLLNISASDLGSFDYKIHTYYDAAVQDSITKVALATDHRIKTASGTNADSAIYVARPNGEITGYHASTPTLRNARRNFASSLKPIAVYAPALELGIVSPATIIVDEPFTAGNFQPRNHDNKHRGQVTVRESLEQSLNIPTVKTLDYTRLPRAVEIANNMGLDLSDDENVSLALGNTKDGTAFTELLGAYCTLANNGIKATPRFVKLIKDRDGKVVYQHTPRKTAQAIGEDTVFLLTDMLQSGTKHGTAKALAPLEFNIAAKTGTAEREGRETNTDAVNCSYTDNYVVVVWHGNASMKPEHDLPKGTTGGGTTSFIARDIHKNLYELPLTNLTNLTKHTKNSPSKGEGVASQSDDGVVESRSIFSPPTSIAKDENTGEYYSLRYAQVFETQTKNFTKPITTTLDGRLSGTGQPIITFNTVAHQHYEIYKDGALQEIIKNHSGEYTFIDTNVREKQAYEYKVITETLESNTIKLYTATDINRTTPPQKKEKASKHWFF